MSDVLFEGARGTYRSLDTIGDRGQYGQAYLCQDPTYRKVVVKTLHAGAPPDGPQVLEREATTLERVAAVEEQAKVQYAVRLLDRGRDTAGQLRFIVMEQATGKNVLDDLVAPITDWQFDPLDESLVLTIAWFFGRALKLVHQAGLTYDDMKLENLFWTSPNQLRIIDWNVVRESEGRPDAVQGDWARFGARLYELYTGERIGLSREAVVTGTGPGGPVWTALPDGVRAFITKALALGYADDNLALSDLKREGDLLTLERNRDAEGLISKATVAEGQPQADAIAILAPLARAERLLRKEPQIPGAAQQLARCAELRGHAESHQGRAAEGSFQKGLTLLSKQDLPTAKEVFTKAYNVARELDPRPRRGLWLVQLAQEYRDLYQGAARSDMERAVGLLNEEKYEEAAVWLDGWKVELATVSPYQWLVFETAVRVDAQAGRLAEASERLSTPEGKQICERWTDLREYAVAVTRRREADETRQRAEIGDRELRETAERALAEARRAEVANAPQLAIEQYRKALRDLRQLRLPDAELVRWLDRQLGQLSRQQELQELERSAQRLDLEQLEQAARAALPELSLVIAKLVQQGQRQTAAAQESLTKTLREVIMILEQKVETTGKLLLTQDKKIDEIKGQVAAQTSLLDTNLVAITGQVVDTSLNAEIDKLTDLIKAGVLEEARKKLRVLENRLEADRLKLMAGRRDLTTYEQALEDAREKIEKQEAYAKEQIQEYTDALRKFAWQEAAQIFVTAIHCQSDQPIHYTTALDQTYPAVAKHVVTALKPSYGHPSLQDVVARDGPLLSMIVELTKVLKEVRDHALTPIEIEKSTRKAVDRLMRIGQFLKELGQMRTNDEISSTNKRFDALDVEDQRSMDQIASMIKRQMQKPSLYQGGKQK